MAPLTTGFSPDQLYRRKYPRRKFRRHVGVLVAGRYVLMQGHEVGEGGLAFVSDQKLATGQMLVVNFKIPHGGLISVRAEIRNVRPMGNSQHFYGCSFLNLKFEAKREIRTFVTARSASEV